MLASTKICASLSSACPTESTGSCPLLEESTTEAKGDLNEEDEGDPEHGNPTLATAPTVVKPNMWKVCNLEYKRHYYCNGITGDTSWLPPPGVSDPVGNPTPAQ